MKLEVHNEKSATLFAPQSAAVFSVLAQLEGRKVWGKGTPSRVSIEASPFNIDLLRENLPSLAIAHSIPTEDWSGHTSQCLDRGTYISKTKPRSYQIQPAADLRTQTVFGLFIEQGGGKTKLGLDRAGELWCEGKIDAVLIFSKKGVHRQWLLEGAPKHLGVDWFGSAYAGGKLEVIRRPQPNALEFLAVNWDSAKAKKGRAVIEEFLTRHQGRVMTIGDESQEIKNPSSARTKAVMELRDVAKTRCRLALTGTPIAKNLIDEWSQINWLDEKIIGVRYMTTFRNKFCVMGGFEGKQIIGIKNLEEFKRLTDPYTTRIRKDEMGLPPKQYRDWTFRLEPVQYQAMQDVRDAWRKAMKDGDQREAMRLNPPLRIQQICSGFFPGEDGEPMLILPAKKNPRLLALHEVLEDTPGKVVVWARFRADIDLLIQPSLEAAGIPHVVYHGGKNDAEREAAKADFIAHKDEGPRVFLATAQAAGTGVDGLQRVCSHAVYYSNSHRAVDRWQSEDRIDRDGSIGQTLITDMIGIGSNDRAIKKNLQNKKDISGLALGDIEALMGDEEEIETWVDF